MVFIPLLVFALIPDFHSEPKRPRVTQTRGTELKPFLTILGTSMRATTYAQIPVMLKGQGTLITR